MSAQELSPQWFNETKNVSPLGSNVGIFTIRKINPRQFVVITQNLIEINFLFEFQFSIYYYFRQKSNHNSIHYGTYIFISNGG
jgi:hypothetical protein